MVNILIIHLFLISIVSICVIMSDLIRLYFKIQYLLVLAYKLYRALLIL